MTAIVLRGDAAHLPLPDASVDLLVTSPPYFGLRSYTDGGEHYDGQIGSEATPAAYVAALVECTREWMRVLKPSGSLFVNLGDKYAGDASPGGPSQLQGGKGHRAVQGNGRRLTGRPKSLMGLPWRYALACIDDLGLILRAEVIWSKPNGLPESVTDRVRRSHEQLFHFTRLPRYYSAVDEIREPHAPASLVRFGGSPRRSRGDDGSGQVAAHGWSERMPSIAGNPLGKLPGSVWDIPSQPLTVPPSLGVDHFAAFPMELPRRIVLGWSPPGICTACAEGRRPIADREIGPDAQGRTGRVHGGKRAANGHAVERKMLDGLSLRTITSYACGCGSWYLEDAQPGTRPAVVLDPFSGTGTTALVASALGRIGIGVDRSADYCRLARWRTTDPAQRAAALQVPKPPPQVDGQLDMYALTD